MIIDTHVHFGEMLNFSMPEQAVLYSMRKYGISYSIVSNCEAAEVDNEQNPITKKLQFSQDECIKKTLCFAKNHPDKIGAALWVKPLTEGVTASFEKMLSENLDIVLAIKVHPFHSKVPFDAPEVEAYIKLAQKYSLPVITHTGNGNEDSCARVFRMAQKYPNVAFIMAHMGLGTDNLEAIEFLSKLPNLYGDTTWVPVESTLLAIKKCGSEKILFGSDNPIDGKDTYFCNKSGERSLYQQYFNEFKDMVSKEDYENIFFKNAIRLFRIPKSVIQN